ncbi:FMN-linked oxidoreductase [Glarea lozoyensis ATCC 20868]|uniref:FMN-linked oxidoreductase n=1 Tax=Glarea lozoyensis (strain ATCC 20868 / MF5171) TaxID=1116229 RepID=S3CTM5_GLAL2|nr:FMN-linked oxidoreductase [Glarea lozoyensis ATCC 20868]EPE29737.1 FMN-linked oxidoreductase [Glarea lozoyensis ATCC 20868]
MGSIATTSEEKLPGNGKFSSSDAPRGSSSKIFTPLTIGNGTLQLYHRIILAPLTRNRGSPLNPNSTPSDPNRIWIPNALIKEYYLQRTTPGGLLISEGIPPNLEGNGMPGVPGLFHPAQIAGWKDVVEAVHEKGGYMYAQLWNAGRACIPQHTGSPTISASATAFEGEDRYSHPPPGTSKTVRYADFPPKELDEEGIRRQIADYVRAAKAAVEECGFDGVEVHGGNGYLPEQFLSSNINVRTDAYGGSPEKRCKFVLELMDALVATIGQEKLAIRLTPFGMFNQARGTQRLETWGYLCKELKRRYALSYVHFVEPRYEQVFSLEEKNKYLESWGFPDIDLKLFRDIFGSTPFVSAGGWNDKNCWGVLEEDTYDAFAIGRLFLSTPDMIERLKNGLPLNEYNRPRFYGPFPDPEVGYTDYPTWEEKQKKAKQIKV